MNTPAAPDKYISEYAQGLLRVLEALFGHEVEGLLPGELSKLAEVSPSQLTRLVANLDHKGWTERTPSTNRIRLAPRPLVQGALRVMAELDRAQRRVDEVQNRFTRQ